MFELAADTVIEDVMCSLDNDKIILDTDENLMDLYMDENFDN